MSVQRTDRPAAEPLNTSDKQQTSSQEAPRAPREEIEDAPLGGISGWGGISTGLEFHVDSTMGSGRLYEAIDAFKKSIEEDVRKKNKDIEKIALDFIPVDSDNDDRFPIPVAILTARIPNTGRVAYFPIAIDLGNAEQRETDAEVNRDHIKIRRLASQVINATTNHLYEYVVKHFGSVGSNLKVSNAIGSVLYNDLDLKDPARVLPFIANAINACGTLVTMDMDKEDLNVADIPDRRTLVASTVVVKNPGAERMLFNEGGRPFRADLRTTLSTPASRAQNGEREQMPKLISQATGYFDIQWNPYESGRDRERTVYTGAYVSTHLSTPRRNSIGGILLAMYASLNVLKDSLARYSLAPDATLDRKKNEEAANLQDIGLLNIEAEVAPNPGPVTDLDATGVRPADIRKYIDKLVHPVIDYHIDIDESGPDTWRMWAFLDAAFNGKESLSNILTSANELCNGHLKKYWPSGNPFSVVAVRPAGTFNENGVQQDLRRIDYVAEYALNLQDSRAIQDWQLYTYDLTIDEDVRKHHLVRLIKDVLPSAKIDGWTYRIEVNPDFLDALIQGMADAELKVNFVAPGDREMRDRYTTGGQRNSDRYADMERRLRSARGADRRDDRRDDDRGGFFSRRR